MPTEAISSAAVVWGVYSDKLSGTSTREQRRGLASLLDYAREGDAIVVVGIDCLGRNAAEVMTTIRELGERGIVLRSLREGIDTSNATGQMVAGGLDLVDLGPRRLRDLPTAVGLFQVRAAGPTHGLSAVAGAGFESGEPAGCGHQLHWARVGGRRGASRGEGYRVAFG